MSDRYRALAGDCLDRMAELPTASVDAIITDPPYALTACEWDRPIDWPAWWAEARRVAKPNAAFVLFSQQPFTTDLINSNRGRFAYELVWSMNIATRFLDANRRPMLNHQNVLVFGKGIRYNRVDWPRRKATHRIGDVITGAPEKGGASVYRGDRAKVPYAYGPTECPKTVLTGFPRKGNFGARRGPYHHPTAKPVALMAWLVKTYSDEGATVLDPFAGSWTTGQACMETGRRFVGIERDPRYFAMGPARLAEAVAG